MKYSYEELSSLNSWLKTQKLNNTDLRRKAKKIDLNSLNSKQMIAYGIIKNHVKSVNSSENQLLYRLEGTAGTGKPHVINVWCNVLPENSYFIAASTGKAAHNVNGVTLHSMLLLGTNRHTLRGEALASLQRKFTNV